MTNLLWIQLRSMHVRALLLATSMVVSACGDSSKPPATERGSDHATADDDSSDDGASDDGASDDGVPAAHLDAGGSKPPAGSHADATTADASVRDASDASTVSADAASSDATDDASVAPPANGSIQRGPADKSYVSKQGPYTTKNYTSGYKDGAHFADATVYYPDSADAQPPFALVAVVPGYVSPQSVIQAWGPFLASHGIVTMTIGTNSNTVQPAERELALMDALDSLAAENTRSGSPLMGKLDTSRRAVMGHSMGGGGTLLAAQDHPELKAGVGLNPWEAGGNFSKDTVPVLMFTATGDTTAPPMQHAYAFYSQIPDSTKKMVWSLQGGSHGTAINPTGANGQIGAYALSWLKIFLEGDTRYIDIAKSMPTGTARFDNTL